MVLCVTHAKTKTTMMPITMYRHPLSNVSISKSTFPHCFFPYHVIVRGKAANYYYLGLDDLLDSSDLTVCKSHFNAMRMRG